MMKRKAGTAVVVLIVLGLLGFTLYREHERSRADVRRWQCSGYLKHLALSMHNYHSTFGSYPPGTIPNPALPPERRLSWVAASWRWHSTWTEFQLDATKPWDQAPNSPPKLVALPHMIDYNRSPENDGTWAACPDDPASRDWVRPLPLTYVGMAGLGLDAPTLPSKHPRAGVFGYDRVTRIEEITDGTIGTAMLAETTLGHQAWMAGGPSSVRGVDPATRPYIGSGRPFGGYHAGGANVAMADGSVRFIRDTIDPKVFEALSTIAGGETIPEERDR